MLRTGRLCNAGQIFLCSWIVLLPWREVSANDWEEWWSYDGISGSDFWGLYNPEWIVCSKGRFQSPVDILTKQLLFDPNLPLLHIDKHKISGNLTNNGHGIIFSALSTIDPPVNITFIDSSHPGGYVYRAEEIHIHWGSSEKQGSEHFIQGQAFPGEQIAARPFICDNEQEMWWLRRTCDSRDHLTAGILSFPYKPRQQFKIETSPIQLACVLYRNFSHAEGSPYGLLALSIFLQLGEKTNSELSHLLSRAEKIRYRGSWETIQQLCIRELLPETDTYITYPGSLTRPGCQETVQWIVLNKPIYISKQQLFALRQIRRGEKISPGRLMENNYRAVQPFGNYRTLRTNIDFNHVKDDERCPSMYKDYVYKAKEWNII